MSNVLQLSENFEVNIKLSIDETRTLCMGWNFLLHFFSGLEVFFNIQTTVIILTNDKFKCSGLNFKMFVFIKRR